MTSRELKSRRNEHAVRGRTTRKEVEHFRSGSVRMPHERSTYERTYLSEPIENHIIPNELSNLNLDKKHLQKRHRIFRRDLEPSRIPVRTLLRLRTRAERLENLFSNVFVRVHTKSSKTYCYIKSLET